MRNITKRILLITLCLFLPAAAAEESTYSVTDRLEQLGYLDSSIQSLVTALKNFQTANSILSTGTLDNETLAALYSTDVISQTEYLENFARKYEEIGRSLPETRDAISALQNALRTLGYPIGAADGVYGDATAAAVAQFQLANGLYATGKVDASTLIRLYEGSPVSWDNFLSAQCASRGDTGTHVKRLQERLTKYGYFEGEPTGSFGELTQQAIAQFQTANKLTSTGDADIETCRKLFSSDAKTRYIDGELYMGNSGEAVLEVQQRLAELGYYFCDPTSVFDEPTRNALMLFQFANDLTVSEYADLATLKQLYRNNADTAEESASAFLRTRNRITTDQINAVASLAGSMQGQLFPSEYDGQYPGFGFVQYVYASEGVFLLDPDIELNTSTMLEYDDPQLVPRGAIIVFRSETESTVHSIAIALGEGRAVYADTASDWIVSGDISQISDSGLMVRVLPDGE